MPLPESAERVVALVRTGFAGTAHKCTNVCNDGTSIELHGSIGHPLHVYMCICGTALHHIHVYLYVYVCMYVCIRNVRVCV